MHINLIKINYIHGIKDSDQGIEIDIPKCGSIYRDQVGNSQYHDMETLFALRLHILFGPIYNNTASVHTSRIGDTHNFLNQCSPVFMAQLRRHSTTMGCYAVNFLLRNHNKQCRTIPWRRDMGLLLGIQGLPSNSTSPILDLRRLYILYWTKL